MIVFAKKDFKPAGELDIQSFGESFYLSGEDNADADGGSDKFDCKKDPLPFSIEFQGIIYPPADESSRKILRNLPFARRGYVFKSPEIAAYYSRQKWYWPDPDYKPVVTTLTKKEQEWLGRLFPAV
jgi:YARHG domain